MSKFRINEKVWSVADGRVGIVKAREVKSVESYTEVKYLVDFGDGIDKWKVVTKKDIKKCPQAAQPLRWIKKEYHLDDGKIVTLAANVENVKDAWFSIGGKWLTIGFSIYNGVDEYNPEIGYKIATHRAKNNPFTTMHSSFSGEFGYDTVVAIMDAKAKYIIDHMDKFYRPEA